MTLFLLAWAVPSLIVALGLLVTLRKGAYRSTEPTDVLAVIFASVLWPMGALCLLVDVVIPLCLKPPVEPGSREG